MPSRARGRTLMVVGLAGALALGVTGCGGPNAEQTASPATTTASAGASAASATPSADVSPSLLTATFTQADTDRVRARVARTNEVLGAAGWMVAVWDPYRGDILLGDGNAAPADHFRIGTVTNTMTAVAALRLVDEGLLSLDTTVDQYVQGLPNGDAITIRMLLDMTAGLPILTEDAAFMKRYLADPNLAWTVDESLDLIRSLPPAHAPGERQLFNTSNYIVLGRVLEQVVGRPADQVIFEQVVEPAGLVTTQLPVDSALPEPAVPGVMTLDGVERTADLQNPQVPFTSGFAISTINDLRTWARTLGTGDLLTSETFQAQLPPESTEEPTYGLGLSNIDGWLGHSGYIWGYSTMMYTEPNSGAVIVTFTSGGPPDAETATLTMLQTVATLYPGQFGYIDAAAAGADAYLDEVAAGATPSGG